MNISKENVIDYIFEKNKIVFSVPYYQRYYVWGKDNCEELYRDIYEAGVEDKPHFFGTFVLMQLSDDDDDIQQYEIVDGQQRVTTIYLLLKALYDLAESSDLKNELRSLLLNKFDSKTTPNDRHMYKIKDFDIRTNDNSPLYILMSKEGSAVEELKKDSSSIDIYRNYFAFKDFITKTKKSTKAQTIDEVIVKVLSGIKQLEISLISLDSEIDKPQIIFERINSTGVHLGFVDLIRNYLLMNENGEDLSGKWQDLEDTLTAKVKGKDKETEKCVIKDFLWSYIVYKGGRERNPYRSFKKIVDEEFKNDYGAVLDDLIKKAKYHAFFSFKKTDYDSLYNKETKSIVRSFGTDVLDLTTIYPFLYQVFDDYKNDYINNEILDEILRFFLSYLVRRSILQLPTNALRNFFRNLYKNIFGKIDVKTLKPKEYLKYVYKYMAKIKLKSGSEAYNNDKVIKSLEVMDLYEYRHGKLCRFLFDMYENPEPEKNGKVVRIDDNSWSIEHIVPETIEGTEWEKAITPKDFSDCLHRIGNLSLATSKSNSILQNKPFAAKKEIYKNFHTQKLYEDVLKCKVWTRTEIEKRGKIISEALINDIFALPEDFTSLLVADNPMLFREEHHSLNEKVNYTNVNFVSVSIRGEEHTEVKTKADLMVKVCEYLYSNYPEKVNSLAENPRGKACFTKESKGIGSDSSMHELDHSGIYIDTHANNNDSIKLLVQILNNFEEISPSDVKITFKRMG